MFNGLINHANPTPGTTIGFAKNDQAEMAVIGSLFFDPRQFDNLRVPLRPSMFSRDDCQLIYAAILELISRGSPLDLVLIGNHLKVAGHLERVGGVAGLGDFAAATDSPARINHYAKIVQANAMKRRAYCKTQEIIEQANDASVHADELLNSIEGMASEIREEFHAGVDREHQVADAIADALAAIDSPDIENGLSTGFANIDERLTLRNGELTILAARPSVGKTGLALNIAHRVSLHAQVLFVSLEMSVGELSQRLLSSEARVNAHRIRTKTLTKDDRRKLVEAGDVIGNQNAIVIDDTASRTVWDIASSARRLKRQRGLGLIVVDYLQLISPINPKAQRQEQVAGMSRALKQLAKELSVPILCLAQLNRQADNPSEPPRLSQLRESGAIEQDADNVLFIHRPGYHDPKADQGLAKIVIAKQRNGPTGTTELVWSRDYARFDDKARADITENYHDTFAEYDRRG